MVNPTSPISLGELIRARREALDLSMHEVARRVGARNTTIIRIESGQIAQPRGDLIGALAEALDLPSADLFAAAGYSVPSELPSFRPYLRSRYHDLPPEAVAELEQTFDDIARRYGTEGPAPGEDER